MDMYSQDLFYNIKILDPGRDVWLKIPLNMPFQLMYGLPIITLESPT